MVALIRRVALDSPAMAMSIERKPWIALCADALHGWDGEAEEPSWTVALPKGTSGARLVGRAGDVVVAPLFDEGRLRVLAVDAQSGAVRWDLSEPARKADTNTIAVAGTTLLMTGRRGSDDVLFGIDLDTGKIAFEHENDESDLVAAAAGTFFVTGFKSLRPVDAKGVKAAVMPVSFEGLRAFGSLLVGATTDKKSGVTAIVAYDAERKAAAGRVEIGAQVGVVRVYAGGAIGRVLATTSKTHEILLVDLRAEKVVWRTSFAPYEAASAAWVDGCVVASLAGAMANKEPRAMLFDHRTGVELPSPLEMAYPAPLIAAEGDLIVLRLAGIERMRWQ
jgi:hypothetical protein